jgi:hypothetical protein
VIQLGVDGSGGLGPVPQQLSDFHQGRAAREEIAGYRVPQPVRADPRDPTAIAGRDDDADDRAYRQAGERRSAPLRAADPSRASSR